MDEPLLLQLAGVCSESDAVGSTLQAAATTSHHRNHSAVHVERPPPHAQCERCCGAQLQLCCAALLC